MKRIVIAAGLAVAAAAANAQTCQQIGSFMHCSDGSSSQRIGKFNYYNYPESTTPPGMPSSSHDIGNFRHYDNGVTRQSIGNFDHYSNGTTRQRIGNFDYYTGPDGGTTTCQRIGNQTFCN